MRHNMAQFSTRDHVYSPGRGLAERTLTITLTLTLTLVIIDLTTAHTATLLGGGTTLYTSSSGGCSQVFSGWGGPAANVHVEQLLHSVPPFLVVTPSGQVMHLHKPRTNVHT